MSTHREHGAAEQERMRRETLLDQLRQAIESKQEEPWSETPWKASCRSSAPSGRSKRLPAVTRAVGFLDSSRNRRRAERLRAVAVCSPPDAPPR